MAEIAFPSLSTTTRLPTGTTYSYIHCKPSSQKPYILFLHGFPSSSYDWRHQISYFSKLGYGVIAPDLLGYGGTDKPETLEAYRMKKMSEEVLGILDAQKVGKVLAVGHDFGSFLLSRLANYFPERFISFAFLDVAYQAPSGPFSVEAINQFAEKTFGYPTFGYWLFFNDPDAADMMNRVAKCTDSLMYCRDPALLKDHMCPIGAARSWFAEGKTSALAPYVSSEDIEIHDRIFTTENGGYGPPLMWYKSVMANVNVQDEATLAPEQSHIGQPTLLITAANDYIAIPAMQEQGMRPYVKNLKVESVETGHWLQLEKPDEVNQRLERFFTESAVA